jgi:hypothetical protein
MREEYRNPSRTFAGSLVPRRTRCGELRYVPLRGEHLRVRLGIGSAHTTVATIATQPDGRFSFSFRFGAGNVVRRYWFQFLTLPEGDYPFTPGASRKVYVTVG